LETFIKKYIFIAVRFNKWKELAVPGRHFFIIFGFFEAFVYFWQAMFFPVSTCLQLVVYVAVRIPDF